MAKHSILLFTATFIMVTIAFCKTAEAATKPSKKIKYPATFQSPSNMSYEELLYILKSRHNIEATPPKTFSPCARAILGCCKDNQIKEKCSEDLGCGAYFFDDNPCEDKFVIDALKAAKAFYRQFFD